MIIVYFYCRVSNNKELEGVPLTVSLPPHSHPHALSRTHTYNTLSLLLRSRLTLTLSRFRSHYSRTLFPTLSRSHLFLFLRHIVSHPLLHILAHAQSHHSLSPSLYPLKQCIGTLRTVAKYCWHIVPTVQRKQANCDATWPTRPPNRDADRQLRTPFYPTFVSCKINKIEMGTQKS